MKFETTTCTQGCLKKKVTRGGERGLRGQNRIGLDMGTVDLILMPFLEIFHLLLIDAFIISFPKQYIHVYVQFTCNFS